MNEHLMHAVLSAALFFATCSDEECNPDLAVRQLEQLGWSLMQLSPHDQAEFRAFVERAAESDPQPAVAAQIRAIADHLIPSD